MNDLPPTPPLPRYGDGATPDPVSRIEELLSAMADGELTPAELLELEEAAVATNSTVQEMAVPFHEGQALAAASVLDLRSPPALRHQQLRSAVDQLDQPEVASLAGARATLASKQHHQRRRMQRLSSVAAALVVVAGIGIIGSQLGGSGSDTAATEEAGAATTSSRELNDEFSEGGTASDDAASDDGELNEMAEAPLASQSGLDASDGVFFYQLQESPAGIQPSELGDQVIDGAIEVEPFNSEAARGGADATAASEDIGDGESDLTRAASTPRCTDAAFALQSNDDIPEITGLALVILDGQTYELYQIADDNFAVFEQGTCNRVD
ncbi:MAG: hypothetical protein HKN03_08530 [Acidimicrobiales bacterium]|nr:hypothetical protein [Acidimicrobiales bacterium]